MFSEIENPIFNKGRADRTTIWVDDSFELGYEGKLRITCCCCGGTQVEQTHYRSQKCLVFKTVMGCSRCPSKSSCAEYVASIKDAAVA